MKKDLKLKIFIVAAEAAPFAKVGGLGDVIGALPLALAKLGADIRVAIPLYGSIDRKKFGLKMIIKGFEILSAGKIEKVNIWQSNFPNSKAVCYFVESIYFQSKEIYKPEDNDNLMTNFLFFSHAILEILPALGFKPDIIHSNDCHMGLVPALLKAKNKNYFKMTKTVFTIHNLYYQGLNDLETLRIASLGTDLPNSLKDVSEDGKINFMRQGILNADIISTVSKTYAKEIRTAEYGAGLEIFINQRKKIYGITNGIDQELFNPSTDKFLVKNYSAKNLGNKILNKLALQKEVGLLIGKDIPVVGMVARVCLQKGFDLFSDDLFGLPCQFVILGTGDKLYEDKLLNFSKKFPGKLIYKNYFDLELAQHIYAGSDIFLMPSKFEPCGLGQMIAMRYGTIPVVRATGGLADTVNGKVGFKFKNFETSEMVKALEKALKLYKNKVQWEKMQKNGMMTDFSWDKSAEKYMLIYKKLV